MSEQEEITLFNRIRDNIRAAQHKMVERKAKLGETVVVADSEGKPIEIPAHEALKLYQNQL